jgi:uncharacterized protein (TIGR00251 family)
MPFKIHASGLTVLIRLTPNARRSEINGKMDSGDGKTALRISINAVPEDGKANKELIAFLAKAWKLPKSSFSLLSGHTNRQKVILIEGDGKKLLSHLIQRSPDLID